MILNLNADVDHKMLDSLIKALNDLKEGDNIHVYFNSPEGGYVSVSEAIIDIINNCKDRFIVSFYGENFSAGMEIMLRLQCKKALLPQTTGMYHLGWQEMAISEGGKPHNAYDIFSMKEMKASRERSIEYLRTTKLSPKEISDIKKGKDVYFSNKRLLELI